ncbi:hypothetical protein AX774_g4646 [Zancudomyces culisetae]|uniref:Uncharacterized protein n=1 Tax=Zancudomyces culisetae TaxID=1213189 RepID=A0A1R1PLT3_ZANCU|nr:hypothetical protein AX774_g4646 [Zancudomyces culisetae]|eukprot:OMH81893.1 hypothetical protein AX774_g4646 [Zancudomyces culisetae]
MDQGGRQGEYRGWNVNDPLSEGVEVWENAMSGSSENTPEFDAFQRFIMEANDDSELESSSEEESKEFYRTVTQNGTIHENNTVATTENGVGSVGVGNRHEGARGNGKEREHNVEEFTRDTGYKSTPDSDIKQKAKVVKRVRFADQYTSPKISIIQQEEQEHEQESESEPESEEPEEMEQDIFDGEEDINLTARQGILDNEHVTELWSGCNMAMGTGSADSSVWRRSGKGGA